MKITDISWAPDRLVLKVPFRYAGGALANLDYARVRVATDTHLHGYGHVAIAPESTGDTLESVAGAVSLLKSRLKGCDPCDTQLIVTRMDAALNFNSACKAAIEAATLMIRSETMGQPLHKIIGCKINERIAITYTLGIQRPEVIASQTREALRQGFRRLKVKVTNDVKLAEETLKAVRQVDATIGISIDANQSLGGAERAIRALTRLAKYRLDWIEQPIARGDIRGNAIIRHALPDVKVMLDESVQSAVDCEYAIDHDAVDMVCIKLAKTGGVTHAMEIVRLCEESGKGYVFASMIESMLSNAVTIHLAACVRALACEAGGFYLIARDVASGLSLESGSVRVPDTPGFGVSIVGS